MTTVPDSKPMPWGPPPPPPPRGAKNLEMARLEKPWIVSQNFVTPGYFAALALPDASRPGLHEPPTIARRRAWRSSTRRWRRARSASANPDRTTRLVRTARAVRHRSRRRRQGSSLRAPARSGAGRHLLSARADSDRARTRAGMSPARRQPINLTLMSCERDRRAHDERPAAAAGASVRSDVSSSTGSRRSTRRRMGRSARSVCSPASAGASASPRSSCSSSGLYGTMAAAVIRSRRELGIRLALGAKPRSLRFLVVGRCLMRRRLSASRLGCRSPTRPRNRSRTCSTACGRWTRSSRRHRRDGVSRRPSPASSRHAAPRVSIRL